jgi:hypothetical protein
MIERTLHAFDVDLQELARKVAEMDSLVEAPITEAMDALAPRTWSAWAITRPISPRPSTASWKVFQLRPSAQGGPHQQAGVAAACLISFILADRPFRAKRRGGKDPIAVLPRWRGLKQLDRFDALRQRYVIIDGMPAGERSSISANSSKGHMRPVGSRLRRVPEGLKQRQVESYNLVAGRAFHPQQARPPGLRAIAEMPEFERERRKVARHAMELLDRFKNGSFIPWRYKREVDIGGRQEPHPGPAQASRALSQHGCDFGRDPQADEDPYRTSLIHSVCDNSTGSPFVVSSEERLLEEMRARAPVTSAETRSPSRRAD